MKTPCDEVDRQLFAACTTITIGNGHKTNFWHTGWLHGRRPKDIAPTLYAISSRKNKTVAEALHNHSWIRDLNFRNGVSAQHFRECANLWAQTRHVNLNDGDEDTIIWKLTKDGRYTASSAYKAQFTTCVKEPRLRAG